MRGSNKLQHVSAAICNARKALVMRGGVRRHSFNTTNLMKHLKSHHPQDQEEVLKSNIEQEKMAPAKACQQLLRHFKRLIDVVGESQPLEMTACLL